MFDIRPGCDSDKTQILNLIGHIFGTEDAERAERRWQWQWRDDPRLDTPGYKGVVTEWNGIVIGNLSCIPSGLYVDGQPKKAFWVGDALVHWGNLRRALREIKRDRYIEHPDLSNGVAGAMLNHTAAGMIQLGKHLTDPMKVVAYKVGSKDQPGTGSWDRFISFKQPLESVIGKFWGRLLGWFADLSVTKIPEPKMDVVTLEGDFDPRFDKLWAKAMTEHKAITRRDMATLNWRYRRHPDTRYTVLTVEQEGELCGYLVYSTFYRHQQFRSHIVDAIAPSKNLSVLEALVSKAMAQMRDLGVHKVECYAGGSILVAALKRAGFAARLENGKEQTAVIRNFGPLDELYITRGDGDGG